MLGLHEELELRGAKRPAYIVYLHNGRLVALALTNNFKNG
jgi:hypothetical protein